MINKHFWRNKKIFLTGHTCFKGSWLSLWLYSMGAKVTGYALNPPTQPALFESCNINELINFIIGDIRNQHALEKALLETDPDIVIHMEAQPLVRDSYKYPVETYATNVMGTVYLLEAVRKCKNVRAVINVTTDKCYENQEWVWGYREYEPMGGHDPYSSSKACLELVTAAWNFGPDDDDAKPVEWIVNRLCAKWVNDTYYSIDMGEHPHEAHYLKLDCSKAKAKLGWHPRWNLEKALDSVIEWTAAYKENKDLRKICLQQIEEYCQSK